MHLQVLLKTKVDYKPCSPPRAQSHLMFGNLTGSSACLVAALSLSTPLSDVARVACRIFTLERLTHLDAAPFDSLATACVTPSTLLDSTACASPDRSLPERIDGNVAYSLYNASAAQFFFDAQTAVQLDFVPHCAGSPLFFSSFADSASSELLCTCDDIRALKTLGSPRRVALLAEHDRRSAAADSVRADRVDELLLMRALYAELSAPYLSA